MAASFTLQVLLAAAFVSIAITPFAALFFSFDAPWYFSISGLGQLFIVLVGNWMFVPVYGIEATAWVRLTARIVLLVFTISLGLWLYQRTRRQKLA
jgi:O-antigen/teichoic acid export membrane protein